MIMDSPQIALSITFVAKAIDKPICHQQVSDKPGKVR